MSGGSSFSRWGRLTGRRAAYLLALLGMLAFGVHACVIGGFLLIMLIVWLRLESSHEPKESVQVK